MLAADLGLTPLDLNSAQTARAQLDAAQAEVNENLGYYGAKLRQVDFARKATGRFMDALTEGLGSLVEADLCREGARLAAARVREELALGQMSLRRSAISTFFSQRICLDVVWRSKMKKRKNCESAPPPCRIRPRGRPRS